MADRRFAGLQPRACHGHSRQMARRKTRYPSRDRGRWLLWWLTLTIIGCVGGIFLGEMTVGNRAGMVADAVPSYATLSANPDAPAMSAQPSNPCLDCPGSYGVGARMRAAREERMDDAFRELGAVDADMQHANEPADDYRYGGRFPDPAPPVPENIAPANNPVQEAADSPVPEDPRP